MMGADLFVKAHKQDALASFVDRIAKLLHLTSVERRESTNYIDEEYFSATALSITLTFAWADEVDLSGYDYWIHLRPSGAWVKDHSFVDGLADLLARRLTIAGETVVIIPDAPHEGGSKIYYALNVEAPHASSAQVTAREG